MEWLQALIISWLHQSERRCSRNRLYCLLGGALMKQAYDQDSQAESCYNWEVRLNDR
jgi:hypothetical protein